jgi:hypothetical protein
MIDENSVRIRRAHPHDAEQLARLHFICSSVQPGSFMHHLGLRFFIKYYQIILKEKTGVVLCADKGKDGIVGLVSATLDSKKQLEAVKKERFKFFLILIPVLIRKPSLMRAMYIRNLSFSAKQIGEGFISSSGIRICYWGWLPGCPSKGKSTHLLIELIRYLENLGVRTMQLEVDRINRKVEVMHRLLGAKAVKEFTTKDGRARIVMEYRLNPKQ